MSVFLAAAAQSGLQVRLESHLTSYSTPAGTPFECVVLRSFQAAPDTLIPRGTRIYGRVGKAQSVGIGFRHERALLELVFDRYKTPDGDVFPLQAELLSIDNAREDVLAHGRIRGVLAANNPGNLLNGFWARPSLNLAFRSLAWLTGAANQVWLKYSMGPLGAAGLLLVRCAIVTFPEPEIHLPPGADMTLKVTVSPKEQEPPPSSLTLLPVTWTEEPGSAGATEVSRLANWVKARSGPITYANGKAASDIFNVVMLGSRQQLAATFVNSGWTEADPRTLAASSRMYRAFSAMHSYASAPVSLLLFKGAPPDLVFEKSLDTVTQRHHVRFWRAGKFEGVEVWLGAATHDTGVKFRLASMSFTHKIDPDVDLEREKIATDLSFAECADEPAYLPGMAPVPAGQSRIQTDGRVAVLASQPCSAVVLSGDVPAKPGNHFSRFGRRLILETRNYLMRDNAYYWGYRLVRTSYDHSIPLLH